MWIRRSELENLLHKYRSAVAIEQGRVKALRQSLATSEARLAEANREIGRMAEDAADYRYVIERLQAEVKEQA